MYVYCRPYVHRLKMRASGTVYLIKCVIRLWLLLIKVKTNIANLSLFHLFGHWKEIDIKRIFVEHGFLCYSILL